MGPAEKVFLTIWAVLFFGPVLKAIVKGKGKDAPPPQRPPAAPPGRRRSTTGGGADRGGEGGLFGEEPLPLTIAFRTRKIQMATKIFAPASIARGSRYLLPSSCAWSGCWPGPAIARRMSVSLSMFWRR